jgi:hypothetical protein
MVEDPYPCLRYPPRFEEAMIRPLPPVPELVVPDWGKRSFRFGPSDDKNDVYSIFKVRDSNLSVLKMYMKDSG